MNFVSITYYTITGQVVVYTAVGVSCGVLLLLLVLSICTVCLITIKSNVKSKAMVDQPGLYV